MDVNKNSYTLGFAAIMVVIVAALLSVAFIQQKPFQDINIELEKKQNILRSVGITVERDAAEKAYDTYITGELVLNNKGEEVEGSAFDIDLAKEIKKEASAQLLPLFIGEVDGRTMYIIPLRGKGLWGPIWGFISLEDDLNKVYGAVFDHKAETPGLGAEINTPEFQIPFTGKIILEEGKLVSIIVQKGGSNGDIHKVDAISGGTITSDGVTDMIEERLKRYMSYFESLSPEMQVKHIINLVESDENLDTTSNISERIIN